MTANFEFPWQYSFPPFFTIQPNLETKKVQLEAWKALILRYCQQNRIYSLEVRQALSEPLFNNREINRHLSYEALMVVLDYLKESGNLEWIDKTKTRCHIFWKTPKEWANLIYEWANAHGKTNTVCTLYELTSGEETEREEFYGLDKDLLLKAIQVLEKEGRAAFISYDGSEGVKFF